MVEQLRRATGRGAGLLGVILAAACGTVQGTDQQGARAVRTVTLLSAPYRIDGLHESMTGPRSIHRDIRLGSAEQAPELLWITGLRSEVVGADGRSAISSEFFCHSNLMLVPSNARRVSSASDFSTIPDNRLATLIPGRLDLEMPANFGLPIYSDERLEYFSMALNLNQKDFSQSVRFRTTISFVADGVEPTRKPLFRRALYAHASTDPHARHAHSSSGSVGAATRAPVPRSGDDSETIHWLAPSGLSENRTDVSIQFELWEDTTAHFATAHLHPYARSVALRDKNTGTILFTIHSRNHLEKRGVADMETWTSAAGIRLLRDHTYELVTVYDNPTGKPVDAMSILYIYLLDRKFERQRQHSRSVVDARGL